MKNPISLTFITLLLAVSSLSAATLYVSLGSANPTPPYTNWVTAATNIQQAVNAAAAGDEVVVDNGVYKGGVQVKEGVALSSRNGAGVTIIDAHQYDVCAYLANQASLSGFTLTNGWAGVSCASQTAFLDNCVLTGNFAGQSGGGAYGGTLRNCTLIGNSAGNGSGGGAYGSILYNCTLSDNSAAFGGGGACQCTLYGCMVSYNNCINNNSTAGGGGAYLCTLYDCTVFSNQAGGLWVGYGGGAHTCALYNCTLSQNAANNGAGAYGGGGGAYGGALHNCTLSGNATLGYGSGGGVYGGTLYNCNLTGNQAELGNGGGAYGSTLYNCTLNGNSAPNYSGGGAYGSSLYDCTLTDNFCSDYGGGAYQGTLCNCTLSGNSTTSDNWYIRGSGGGAYQATLYNCIVYYNTSALGGNFDPASTLNYCCTTPLPTSGVGNIASDPLFVDTNGWSNLRLQANSPCINSGNNAYVGTTNDLDGNPRIVSGTVDIGAYEYQGAGSVISYAWLQQYGLPTDGSADFIDSDGDGMNNWQEWICGTCPTNAQSVLRLVSATPAGTNITVTWQSAAGVNYFLERSTNLASPFTHLASFIMGQAGTTSYADTNAAGAGPLFYRVGVLPSGTN